MMHFDEWWNSAAADSFRAKHEDLDGEVFRTVWDAAQLGQAAAQAVQQVDTCETCQGNGEVVTDWNRYKHPHPGDKGDEAVSMCQECNGTGEVNATHPAEGVPAQAVAYAEARECEHCNHVGINDAANGIASCTACKWNGDSPKEDKCPDCEAEGTMTASCPKCHHEYRLIADATLAATQPAAQGVKHHTDDQYLMDAVLSCPHTITHESITLHFSPKQKAGHNALAQLRHRLTAYDAAAKAREMELLAVIEDLERLIPLINQVEAKA